MNRYFFPGLLFGCAAVPTHASPAESDRRSPIEVRLGQSELSPGSADGGEDGTLLTPGWSAPFSFWSARSQDEVIKAINAEDQESAELHEMRALVNVWRALSEITDLQTAELERLHRSD